MRAAIYARVSTERQERQQTIDSQLTALRDWARAQTHALAEVHVFRDESYSGFGAQIRWWTWGGRWTRFQAMRCDTGIPSRVIRLSTAQPTRASAFWAGRVRARRPRPMIAL